MRELKAVDITNLSIEEKEEYIRKSNAECGNTVTAENFNETMKGYVKFALNYAQEDLHEEGFTENQINRIKSLIKSSLNWGIDMMTLEEARKFYEKGC